MVLHIVRIFLSMYKKKDEKWGSILNGCILWSWLY